MPHLTHITAEDVARYGVVAAPDRLIGKAADNKAIFDRLVRELVAVVVNNIIDEANTLMDAEDVRTEQETGRVTAEAGRVTAESARVQAEGLRTAAEQGRETSENIRAQAERARAGAESGRVETERARVVAEAARVDENTGIVAQATAQAQAAAGSAQAAQGAAETAARDAVSQAETRMEGYVSSAAGSAQTAGTQAARAQTEADRAKTEADKAASIVGADFIIRSDIGAPGGVAPLEERARVPLDHLPYSQEMGGIPIVTTYTPEGGTDGVDYAADVPGVNELYPGLTVTIIPHARSTSIAVKFSLNGKDPKALYLNSTRTTSGAETIPNATFITANYPVVIQYGTLNWHIISSVRVDSATLFGEVPVKKGGTGLSTVPVGSYLVGNGTEVVNTKTPEEVRTDIGAVGRTVVTFTAEQWGAVGEDKLCRLDIAQSLHQCADSHYGYTVRHLVDGVLKETTWACVCLATEWRESDKAIVLVSEDPFGGEIVFFG